MSQVYSTEPQTTGRVVMETSHGPIDVNLWCTECPTTTRAFLQLCIDGYFNGMLFHRILNDFLIQTGLTRSTATRPDMNVITSEEATMEKYMKQNITNEQQLHFLNRKKLEVCPRIKFNHRGQVALAIPLDSSVGKGSDSIDQEAFTSSLLMRQFFITLSEASFLNHKHVIFGTVSGPTIFNAIRIGKTEVDADGVAVDFEHVPKIIAVKIDFHPFADLVLTKEDQVPWKKIISNNSHQDSQAADVKERRKQRKGKRDVNILSFGDEMQEDDATEGGPVRVQSIHDVVSQPKKTKTSTRDTDDTETSSNVAQHPTISATSGYNDDDRIKANVSISIPDDTKSRKMQMHPTDKSLPTLETSIQQNISANQHTVIPESSLLNPSHDNKDVSTRPSAIEARRAKYLSHRQGALQRESTREETTLSKLQAFKNKISILKHDTTEEKDPSKDETLVGDDSLASRMAHRLAREEARSVEDKNTIRPRMSKEPVYSGQLLETTDVNVDSSSSWMKTHFQCKRHMDTDMTMGGDGRNMDEYQVIDTQPQHGGKKGKHKHSTTH